MGPYAGPERGSTLTRRPCPATMVAEDAMANDDDDKPTEKGAPTRSASPTKNPPTNPPPSHTDDNKGKKKK
jgi:hypothetical protein